MSTSPAPRDRQTARKSTGSKPPRARRAASGTATASSSLETSSTSSSSPILTRPRLLQTARKSTGGSPWSAAPRTLARIPPPPPPPALGFERPALEGIVHTLLNDPATAPAAMALVLARQSTEMEAFEEARREELADFVANPGTSGNASLLRHYLRDEKEIRAFGLPGANRLAFEYILHVADCSLKVFEYATARERFNVEADATLVGVARARRAEGTPFMRELVGHLARLRRTARQLDEDQSKTWFPGAIEVFDIWLSNSG